MPSATQNKFPFLSPTQKIKVYDFEGVQYVAARVTDTGLTQLLVQRL